MHWRCWCLLVLGKGFGGHDGDSTATSQRAELNRNSHVPVPSPDYRFLSGHVLRSSSDCKLRRCHMGCCTFQSLTCIMPKNPRRRLVAPKIPCLVSGCPRTFTAQHSRTQHMNSAHPDLSGHTRSLRAHPVIERSPSPPDLQVDDMAGPAAQPSQPEHDTHGGGEGSTPTGTQTPTGPRKVLHPYLTGMLYAMH